MGLNILSGIEKPRIDPTAPFVGTQNILDALQPFETPARPISINVTE
jgi:hypothetical protein